MRVKISVFTSPTCPHCPSAVKLVEEVKKENKDVFVVEYDSLTFKGQKEARKYQILSVPTIIVKGSNPENIGFRGTPSKKNLLKAIRIAKEEEQFEEEKSFKENFLEFIRKTFKINIKL